MTQKQSNPNADPCWDGTYIVQGPFPGDEQIVSQEELNRMVETGETTNCTIVKNRDASHPHFWTHYRIEQE